MLHTISIYNFCQSKKYIKNFKIKRDNLSLEWVTVTHGNTLEMCRAHTHKFTIINAFIKALLKFKRNKLFFYQRIKNTKQLKANNIKEVMKIKSNIIKI